MNFKRIISLIAAGAFSMSALAVTASADKIGSASIFLADETWSSQVYWGNGIDGNDTIGIADIQPVEITGDGTYTTSVKFSEAMDYGFFFCLSSDIKGTGSGSFADYPDAEMSITSVKADGREIAGNSAISDFNDNGYMKVNIFDPLTDASENFADSLEWTSGIKSMEVTFTVTGTGVLSADASEDEAVENQPSDSISDEGSEGTTDGTTGGADGTTGGADSTTGAADGSDSPADNSEAPADEPVSGEAEENIPADGSTEAPDTGNAPMSPMAAITALAGLVAFMTKKK